MFVRSSTLLLIVATCLWGGNFVAGKVIVDYMPPITLSLFRWSVALVIVTLLFGRTVWLQRQLYVKQWKFVLFLSLTGVAGFNTFTYIAVQYTNSINASLMNAATPIVIVVLSTFVLRETFSRWRSVGIIVSLTGVCWIISRGSWQAIMELSFNIGDLWMLAAVVVWALYSIGMKKAAGRFPPNELFTVTIGISVIVLLPASLIEISIRQQTVQWSWELVAGILYVGILASIVAFTCWNRALSLIGPASSAIYLNLIPLFSAIFATLFVGEQLKLYHVCGALLIIGGVYITNVTIRKLNV